MDDTRKSQIWDELEAAFPDDLNGSRTLITSHITEEASHANSTPFFLRFLDESKSWELFCKKSLRGGQIVPPALKLLGNNSQKVVKGYHFLLLCWEAF